ncbi:hypothetical protein V8E52_006965 [Russula decolorans]
MSFSNIQPDPTRASYTVLILHPSPIPHMPHKPCSFSTWLLDFPSEESCRWKECNSQLLMKYDHIDPTEFQSLKDDIESLQVEKLDWETERVTHTSRGFYSG